MGKGTIVVATVWRGRLMQAWRVVALGLALGLLTGCGLMALAQTAANPDGTPHTAKLDAKSWSKKNAKVKIALASDSTVQESSGWGNGFAACLTPDVDLLNLAVGGRSSRSYREEGRWAQVLSLKPDYVLVGFSHNDASKNKPEVYVTPDDFRVRIDQFVDEARAAGIKIVLMTQITSKRFDKDGKIENLAGAEIYDGITREEAKAKHVPLMDMAAVSTAYFMSIGVDKTNALTPVHNGKLDAAHLNAEGSVVVGKMAAEELKKAVPELAQYVK